MSDYSSFLSCSIGTADFQLADYSYKQEPVVKEGVGQTSTKVTITGEGWVQAVTAAAFGEAIAAIMQSLSVGGQDVTITGLAGVKEVSLPAAQCTDGGPFIQFEMRKGSDAALRREFGFTVTGSTFVPSNASGGGSAPAGYKVTTQVRPDGLRVISRTGELTGPDSGGTFLTTILPAFRALYALPNWVVTYQYDLAGGAGVAKTSYTLSAEEQADPLPATAAATTVQGTGSTRVERDEQMRRVTTTEVNLLVVGDPDSLVAQIRPKGVNVTILRESVSITRYREQRLSASFTVLEGGNGNALMDWQQSFGAEVQENNTFDVATYVGRSPIAFLRPATLFHYTQSGRAVGVGKFPKEPAPMYSTFGSPNTPRFNHLNAVEKETSWSYSFLLKDSVELTGIILASLDRPAQPRFY